MQQPQTLIDVMSFQCRPTTYITLEILLHKVILHALKYLLLFTVAIGLGTMDWLSLQSHRNAKRWESWFYLRLTNVAFMSYLVSNSQTTLLWAMFTLSSLKYITQHCHLVQDRDRALKAAIQAGRNRNHSSTLVLYLPMWHKAHNI